MSQPTQAPEKSPRTSESQLFCCKSIDKLIADSEDPERRLKKTLGPVSLTALGIGAVIGSGIFTVIGTAIAGQKFDTSSILNAPLLDYLIKHTATTGRPGAGPALALSLVLVAIVCAFTGLCYAELASMIPIAGSAYTYTYATMGELIAWIIGWDLILEYAVSNMAVSVGFAQHLVNMFDWFGWHPGLRWVSPAYLPGGMSGLQGEMLYAPGLHFGFNVPAFLVVMILTVVLVRGIRESAEANNTMVILKIAAILAFIIVGANYINPKLWHPFAPMGWSGILTGGSIIFFTYIGFDSVSTAAEEAKNPQRDLPIGIIATLIVCTILYIGVAVVLTGIVPWESVRDDAAPVVNSMKHLTEITGSATLRWVRLGVLFGAMMGMISSLLVFQLGQARVWFSMSRDGLLPKLFCHVHPRFRTPSTATWIAGFVVGIPAGILDIGTLSDLSNIGTLFAFVLVSLGVIILRYREPNRHRGFRAPGGIAAPVLSVVFCALLMSGLPILTWLRFFGWLLIGLGILFSWSRWWSEFASPDFKQLLRIEQELETRMSSEARERYKSHRKNHGIAWFLCLFLFGAHQLYLKRPFRGFLYIVLTAILIALVLNSHSIFLILVLALVLALIVFTELLRVVPFTQKYNVELARRLASAEGPL